MNKLDSIIGCIIGTAVGDSIGLCLEGLTPERANKLFGNQLKQRFFLGKGMISDDTEHTIIVALALIKSKGNIEVFNNELEKQFKKWLLTLPSGVGLATLKAIMKLLFGSNCKKSGVFSAGNGPAMRSSIIGLCYGDKSHILKDFIKSNTFITHTDVKAYIGALTVAVAAYTASKYERTIPEDFYNIIKDTLKNEPAEEFLTILKDVIISINLNESTKFFSEKIGLQQGITGYSYHTIPCVIHCWLRNQGNYKNAITEIVNCGGDTDTTAAILGGILGSSVGINKIPKEWINNIKDWPYNIKYMVSLSNCLFFNIWEGKNTNFKEAKFHKLFIRNLFFMFAIIIHLIRRLLPPY